MNRKKLSALLLCLLLLLPLSACAEAETQGQSRTDILLEAEPAPEELPSLALDEAEDSGREGGGVQPSEAETENPQHPEGPQTAEQVQDTGEDGQTESAPEFQEAQGEGGEQTEDLASEEPADLPVEGVYYYDLENVVLYLELYDTLPDNFVTKREARELGWTGGSVQRYLAGAAIGGDRFGNREGSLPTAKGRSYTECDLNTDGASSRGAERLVFSSDGLYFYTGDHYEHFTEYIVTEDWEVLPK